MIEEVASKFREHSRTFSLVWKIAVVSLLLFCFYSNEANAQNRVLVVSGGGARGAWGGGVVQNLVQKQHYEYDVVIGTSTGSLMAPLIVANDFDTLRTMYTTVTNKNIFSIDPFKVSRDGKVAGIRGLRAVKRLITGKKTLGETKKLRKLIEKTYHPAKYEAIQKSDAHFIISVANFTNSHTYYFDSRDFNDNSDDRYRAMMLDHIWRSSNQPLFMTLDCTDDKEYDLVNKDMNDRPFSNGDCWVDAGIRDNIPLLRGIEYSLETSDIAATDTIDVIINNIDSIDIDLFKKKNILPSVVRSIDIMSFDVRFNDVNVPGELVSETMLSILPDDENKEEQIDEILHGNGEEVFGDIVINYYFMPREVYDKHPLDLYFDKKSMNEIWEMGLTFHQLDNTTIKTEVLSKKVALLLLKKAVKKDELYIPEMTASTK
ncbi:MAG: patatin-like phospholipase family protein [Cyclobacteriaceae bacterium]